MITSQSHSEVLNVVEANRTSSSPKQLVMSISPQSLASLSAFVSYSAQVPISPEATLRRLTQFAKQTLGFHHVYDTTFAREIALRESGREFQERWDAAVANKRRKLDGMDPVDTGTLPLPMLASACPGWICYAEKTHGEMIPYISRIKSPQQIMGSLVKEGLGSQVGLQPSQIYHVSVMPCYDKKLEASRPDFAENEVRDVDCVLTTHELHMIMMHYNTSLVNVAEGSLDTPFPQLLSHPGSGSGSYLHAVMRHVITERYQSLSGIEAPDLSAVAAGQVGQIGDSPLTVKTHRNSDFTEYTVIDTTSSKTLLRFATCYGFRNLQNLVRKVKKGGAGSGRKVGGAVVKKRVNGVVEDTGTAASEGWDFVEVMACPSGCINGGGQMPAPSIAATAGDMEVDGQSQTLATKDWLAMVSSAYDQFGVKEQTKEVVSSRADVFEAYRAIESDWIDAALHTRGEASSKDSRRALWNRWTRTEYRDVGSADIANPLGVKW